MNKVIFLEFNELCPALLERFIGEGKLPNFKKLKEASVELFTLADAAPPALEPWIQWYSLHTGIPYSKHKVFSLTDGQTQTHKDIWQELNEHGLRTLNCGSMNVKDYQNPLHTSIPDPWCTKNSPSHAELKIFHNFVSEQVIGQTARKSVLEVASSSFAFLTFMLTHGLSFRTVKKTFKQLWFEKTKKLDIYWKRVAIMDWLQTDLFVHLLKKTQPDFATFFLNSTAHLQHAYWRHLEPEKFNVDVNGQEYKAYQNVVLFGYQNMDEILGRLFDSSDADTRFILSTALSQKAFISEREQIFYRFKDEKSFITSLGFSNKSVAPVMTHQYIYVPENEADGKAFYQAITDFVLDDGVKVFGAQLRVDGSVYFGTALRRPLKSNEQIYDSRGTAVGLDLSEVVYRIPETKSGCHDPKGVLWWDKKADKLNLEVNSEIEITSVFGMLKTVFNS